MIRLLQSLLCIKPAKHPAVERNATWSSLPLEMKTEVMKHADFITRNRMRRCSRADSELTDQVVIRIPFMRLTTDYQDVSVTLCESHTKVVRIDVMRKKSKFRKTRTVITVSYNPDGLEPKEYHPRQEYETILDSLFDAITRQNVIIGTLNLHLKNPPAKVRDFLSLNYQNGYRNHYHPKILCSGLEFLNSFLDYLNVKDARIIADCARKTDKEIKLFAGKRCAQDEAGTPNFQTEYFKASILLRNVEDLIGSILWNIESPMEFYWIPGLQEPRHIAICAKYEGTLWEFPEMRVITIPSLISPIGPKILIIKLSKCGVAIEKFHLKDAPKAKDEIDRSCGLKWMCSNCDKTVESWYFRQSLKMENPSYSFFPPSLNYLNY